MAIRPFPRHSDIAFPTAPRHSDIETPVLAATTPSSSCSSRIRHSLSTIVDGIISNNSFGVLQNENASSFRTLDLSDVMRTLMS